MSDTCQIIRQSVSLSVCQSVSLSVCQYFSLSVCQSGSLSVSQTVSFLVCQSVSLSVYQFVSLSICQSLSLSICQSKTEIYYTISKYPCLKLDKIYNICSVIWLIWNELSLLDPFQRPLLHPFRLPPPHQHLPLPFLKLCQIIINLKKNEKKNVADLIKVQILNIILNCFTVSSFLVLSY